jgi:hypothetical protein
VSVIFYPSFAVWAYALGTLAGVLVVGLVYYGYFYYYISILSKRDIPFHSLKEFLPNYNAEVGVLFIHFFVLKKIFF